jgi:hypothetical protein
MDGILRTSSLGKFSIQMCHNYRISYMRSPLMNVDMVILLLQVTNRFMERILDNADTLKLLHAGNGDDLEASPGLCAYVPRGICIIWTSRDANIVGSLIEGSQDIEVGAMTDEEVLLLLDRSAQGQGLAGAGSESEIKLLE